jgi:hypothetical protein
MEKKKRKEKRKKAEWFYLLDNRRFTGFSGSKEQHLDNPDGRFSLGLILDCSGLDVDAGFQLGQEGRGPLVGLGSLDNLASCLWSML